MIQKHRISTNIGRDQKVNVELKQDYDLLEILSLKFSQKDVYQSLCSDYGVVCGRVSANNGFGIPNVRVSIFIPLTEDDENDPVISALYPYKQTSDVNNNGYKYNLLPSRKQHGGHAPTGTFPDQSDILSREEILEVYEKYYRYTVKTNESGDFMIWGVPIGSQTLHIDVDLSDIGCFSLRPDDFIAQGAGVDQFQNTYKFKSSSDLSSLPQIVTFEKTIEVYPFWGNIELCQIGITRTDFDLADQGVTIQPKAIIIGGTFTDTGKHSVNKNCRPRKKMGRKCDLTSEKGIIETIRFTPQKDSNSKPILEELDTHEDIDESGSFVMSIDMNMDYLITNEFGENEYSNDPNKGIPTSAVQRFRFSVKNETLGRVRTTASYLVPNIKEHVSTLSNPTEATKSYAWSTNFDDYPVNGQSDILNNVDGFWYPQDYFYRFTYNKVYTVSSFQNSYEKDGYVKKEQFLGIKEIAPAEEEDCTSAINTFPINFGVKNYTFTLLIADVLLFVEHFLNIVKLGFFNTIVKILITAGCAIDHRPIRSVARKFKEFGFDLQERSQKKLYLITYPECDECTGDDENALYPSTGITNGSFCTSGTLHVDNPNYQQGGLLDIPYASFSFTASTVGDCATCTDPLLNITAGAMSNPYYASGYTSIAQFIDNQTHYVVGNDDVQGITLDQGMINGTPLYWTSYYYDFSSYVGVTNLDLIYNGVSYNIPDPISSGSFFTNFPANSFGPSGATLTISAPQQFTVAPNCTKTFGILTVTHSLGTNIVFPSITTSSIVIDYTNIKIDDQDSVLSSPLPYYPGPSTGFNLNIYYVFTDTIHSGVTTCLQQQPTLPTTLQIESGCDLYDSPYNEDLIYLYATTSGATSDTNIPGFGDNFAYTDDRTFVTPGSFTPGGNIEATIISDLTSSVGRCTSSKSGTPDIFYSNNFGRQYPLPRLWIYYREKDTKSGVSEFKNGVFYIVPGSQSLGRLYAILREYRKRKRVAKMFCGGIVNYSFINNWLSGSLYFFAFKAKNKRRNNTKYCTDIVRWIGDQERFYYKSCSYNDATGAWGTSWYNGEYKINRPTTFVDLGPRDEFIKEICTDTNLDPNCSVSRIIGPTSFRPFGELQGLNINYRLDVSNDKYTLDNFFSNTGFTGYKNALNGDVMQLISINSEAGIEEFDLQNPKYLGYSYQVLDPELFPDVFSTDNGVGGVYVDGTSGKPNGPLPVTFDLTEDGERVRLCLNEATHLDYSGNTVQGRLTESSQPVPFYLWEKNARGFGDNTNTQHWDFTQIEVQPLQGMTYGYSLNYSPNDDSDPYLLLPMTYTYSGLTMTGATGNATNELPYDVVSFVDNHTLYDNEYPGYTFLYVTSGTTSGNEIIAYTGTLYTRYGSAPQWETTAWDYNHDFMIRRTEDYYSGSKQILSTPFLFYFGLRPGNTGLDKFIERFGPTGAFPSAE
jgi:hypothetical protein